MQVLFHHFQGFRSLLFEVLEGRSFFKMVCIVSQLRVKRTCLEFIRRSTQGVDSRSVFIG